MLRWNALVVAALVGIAIVTAVWWAGPGMLGTASASQGTVAVATVSVPAACTAADPRETVQFEVGGQPRTGALDACGHDKDDRVDITVPADSGTDQVNVHLADVIQGQNDLRRPIGLALLALSCLGGGTYAFLVQRGPRRQPALAI